MPPVNRVAVSLSTQERQELVAAVAALQQKLPFLVSLTADERRTMLKLGDKSQAFVQKALKVATQYPEHLPRSLDVEEMRKDVELFDGLQELLLPLGQLLQMLEDTAMVAGSEAYAASLQVYSHTRASAVDGSLEGALDDLGQRFARKGRSPAGPTTLA